MFVLLVKIRLLGLWNVARFFLSRQRALSIGLTLLGIVFFWGIYAGFRLFLAYVRMSGGVESLTYEVFYFLFLFLLAGAVPFVASTLLHSADYLLLFAAPVRPRAVVAAKLLDATVSNSLQFMVIGLPAIAACGSALELSIGGWLALALVVVLFVLLPTLATTLALLISLSVLGIRRVRGAITATNGVMAAAVCLTLVAQAGRVRLQPSFREALRPVMVPPSPLARYGPSGWLASVLVHLSRGEIAVGLLRLAEMSGAVALLYLACLWLGNRLLSAAALSEEETAVGDARAMRGEMRSYRSGLLRIFSAPMAALIAKDLRYILRDSILLSQLGMPVALFIVPFLLAIQGTSGFPEARSELPYWAAGMTGIIVFMQTSILSMSSIGLESRSFWLVRASPTGGRLLVGAKFAMSTLVSASVGIVLTALSTAVFHFSLFAALVQCGILFLCCVALCGIGVGISAALPRFVYENPAHRVSAWAMILGFVVSTAYVTFTGTLAVTIWWLADQWTTEAMWIYAMGGALFLLLTLFVTLIPLMIGARRIETYPWEY